MRPNARSDSSGLLGRRDLDDGSVPDGPTPRSPVGLEEEANTIREYESEIIPGLFQTEAYMRALMDAAPMLPPDKGLERRVAVRLKRQELLAADDAHSLWVVLNEAALRREVGGAEVMGRQLHRLTDLSRLSRLNSVMLQILPFSAGAHPAMQHGFFLLGFSEPADPDVAYVEYRTGGLFFEQPSEVRSYGVVFDHLVAKALPPDESRRLIEVAARQMTGRM